ncbi:c-type cytochrome [Sphingomonas oligophenolica]
MLSAAQGGAAQTAPLGQKLFQKNCAACHTGATGAFGPSLRGVVNRRAGSQAGFGYSAAMARSKLVWTPQLLRRFLSNPRTIVPGNRMPLAPQPPGDADSIVEYLETLK